MVIVEDLEVLGVPDKVPGFWRVSNSLGEGSDVDHPFLISVQMLK